MANYTSNLKTWGSTGSAHPSGYSYVEGEQPVDEWDNFVNYNLIADVNDHLIPLTNSRIESDYGGSGNEPASPDPAHLYYDEDNERLEYWDSSASTWRNLGTENDEITINSGDGIVGGATISTAGGSLTLSIEPADFAGHGLEDDGSDNLRLDGATIGTGINGGDGVNLSLNESVLKDGGAKEIDASELSGGLGNAGEILETDGSATSWVAASSKYFPSNAIALWSGAISNIPSGWVLCDGNNGTPNLQDRFVVGAGSLYSPGDTGGANSVALTQSELASHSHSTQEYAASSGNTLNFNTGSFDGRGSGTNSAGGDSAHENRPPYYALAYIMKV